MSPTRTGGPVHAVIIGRDFRDSLHRPLPCSPASTRPRVVPPFSLQSRQKNTVVQPPPRCHPRQERQPKRSNFHIQYKRGDLPVATAPGINGMTLIWKVKIEDLDFHHYLPMFFEGLREREAEFREMARSGVRDMLRHGPRKVLPVVPQLIMPMKHALDTRHKETMSATMKVLQDLVRCDPDVGEALVPYYRQILPIFNVFKDDNVNCWDAIDYSEPLGDLIDQTLNTLERYGGEDAFVNIKYMVPTYESCMYN